MKSRTARILLGAGAAGLILAGGGAVLGFRLARHFPRQEIMKDVRAGLATRSRHIEEPGVRVEAFLEARYGPLTDPAVREKVFLDFFDVDHIKGMNFIVGHTPANQKAANTKAMAQWIAHYRETMLPEERAALQARLNSDAGRLMLRQATKQYQSQDVYFQGAQKPVVAELMTTLASLRKQ
jgi:hypothetical protein